MKDKKEFLTTDAVACLRLPSCFPVSQSIAAVLAVSRRSVGRVQGRHALRAGVPVNKQDGSLFEVTLNSRHCQDATIML